MAAAPVNPEAMIQQLLQQQSPQQLPQLPGSPQGQLPKNGTEVAPLLQTMSPAQAGGPMAQPRSPEPKYQAPVGGADKTMSAITAGMKGLGAGIREAKQKKFEQEASEAAIFTAASIAEEKQKAGMPLTAQELQSIKMAGSDKLSKKKAQIMEKAMTDPMSGAYVGTQRAHQAISQAAIDAEERKEKLAKMMADIAYRQQQEKINQQKADQQNDANDIKQQEENRKKQADQDKPTLQDMKQNFKRPVVDEQGNLQRSPNGTLMSRDMTLEDINGNPVLEQRYQEKKQKIQSMIDKSKAEAQDSYSKRIAANASMLRAQKYQPGQSGRGAGGGAIMARNTMLAGMANEYLEQMKSIATKRPDLFGPSGLLGSKMEQAAGDGDRDAMEYIKLAQAASLPLSGMHNMRNQKVVGDVEKTLRSQWQSPQSALDGIKTYQDTAQGVIDGKYTGAAQANPQVSSTQPATPSQTKTGPKKVITVTAEDMK